MKVHVHRLLSYRRPSVGLLLTRLFPLLLSPSSVPFLPISPSSSSPLSFLSPSPPLPFSSFILFSFPFSRARESGNLNVHVRMLSNSRSRVWRSPPLLFLFYLFPPFSSSSPFSLSPPLSFPFHPFLSSYSSFLPLSLSFPFSVIPLASFLPPFSPFFPSFLLFSPSPPPCFSLLPFPSRQENDTGREGVNFRCMAQQPSSGHAFGTHYYDLTAGQCLSAAPRGDSVAKSCRVTFHWCSWRRQGKAIPARTPLLSEILGLLLPPTPIRK